MAQLPEAQERRGPSGVAVVAAMAALMWVLELLDAVLGGDLDRYGIEPRETTPRSRVTP